MLGNAFMWCLSSGFFAQFKSRTICWNSNCHAPPFLSNKFVTWDLQNISLPQISFGKNFSLTCNKSFWINSWSCGPRLWRMSQVLVAWLLPNSYRCLSVISLTIICENQAFTMPQLWLLWATHVRIFSPVVQLCWIFATHSVMNKASILCIKSPETSFKIDFKV